MAVRALGEIALRVRNLASMTEFYRDVVGLDVIRQDTNMAFFRIATGYDGHTQIVALFDRSAHEAYQRPEPAYSSIDHFAFSIDLADFDSEKNRLEGLGLSVETAVHKWVQWRSLYFRDPEGNEIEFVCFDPTV